MITTVLAVFSIPAGWEGAEAEYVLWNKGLNSPITPLPEVQKIHFQDDRAFWDKFVQSTQVTHLLVLTPVDFAVQSKRLYVALAGLYNFSIIPRALAVAYGCNQGQLLVVDSCGPADSVQVVPVVDYQVQSAHSQVAQKEDLARVIWECAQQAGMDHPGRTSLLLENICLVASSMDESALKSDLEKRLPVTAFAGDAQPKKISFRATPEYHGPIPTEMISFFGALVAARAIFSTDSLYTSK